MQLNCHVQTVLAELTIEALEVAVGEALRRVPLAQANGQVREVPDRRTIRYYTTLGLLDRPAAMRGRTALYGRRHVEQLVAIKRLQAEGRSLAEIQTHLVGLSDAELSALAGLPDEADALVPAPPAAPQDRGDRGGGARSFWRDPPAAPAPAPLTNAPTVAPVTELRLGELRLLLPGAVHLTSDDLSALADRARPLIDYLTEQNLLAREEPSR